MGEKTVFSYIVADRERAAGIAKEINNRFGKAVLAFLQNTSGSSTAVNLKVCVKIPQAENMVSAFVNNLLAA